MNNDTLQNLREEYTSDYLEISDLDKNPLEQFKRWFQFALSNNVPEANAFSLATVNKDGKPFNRIVLIKEIRPQGIVFFTNYKSEKGKHIEQNPYVSACFYWQPLFKQIRIEGICEKIDPTDSDIYFKKRPLGSQIGAYTSPQSQPIESRQWLEKKWEENTKQFGNNIQRPDYWGGYIIKPTQVELWQGQPSRLHDRFRYSLEGNNWTIHRLAP